MVGLAMERPPTSLSTRSTISCAALLVNVMARMASGITPMIFDEIGDAKGDDPGLAAARAREDEDRPVCSFNGGTLLRVELVEKRQIWSGSEVP